MDKQQRLVFKQLTNHQNIDENLPKYADYMDESYREYALIQLAMNLYTMQEMNMDAEAKEAFATEILDEVQKLTGRYVLDHVYTERKNELKRINSLRSGIVRHMEILTAYTDALQIYEHILNRLEYLETNEEFSINTQEYADKLFSFIFSSNDKMVINTKIQQVVSELPVRITKNRFYDIVNESLKIYTGAEKQTLSDFSDSILACSGLKRPKGFESEYPELFSFLKELENLDYMHISSEQVLYYQPKLRDAADTIGRITTDYLMLQDIVNELYAVMLTAEYVKNETKNMEYASKVLESVLDAMANNTEIGEQAEDCLFALEGAPEEIAPVLLKGEGLLSDSVLTDPVTLEDLEIKERIHELQITAKLLGNSPFADIDSELSKDATEPADSITVKEEFERLSGAFSTSFMANNKLVNRARMAITLQYLPVFFNSQDEIKDYIGYALLHCNNDCELRSTVEILDDIMAEEV